MFQPFLLRGHPSLHVENARRPLLILNIKALSRTPMVRFVFFAPKNKGIKIWGKMYVYLGIIQRVQG